MSLFKKKEKVKEEIIEIKDENGERIEVDQIIQSKRLCKYLKMYGVKYLDQLVSKNFTEVCNLPYMGLASAQEIEHDLKEHGYVLKPRD